MARTTTKKGGRSASSKNEEEFIGITPNVDKMSDHKLSLTVLGQMSILQRKDKL